MIIQPEKRRILDRYGIEQELMWSATLDNLYQVQRNAIEFALCTATVNWAKGNRKPITVRTYLRGGEVEDLFCVKKEVEAIVRIVIFKDMKAKRTYDRMPESATHHFNQEWWKQHQQDYLKNIHA